MSRVSDKQTSTSGEAGCLYFFKGELDQSCTDVSKAF